MPLMDHFIGNVQIQERRPKSWNEPRRKRLSFVRPHNEHSRHSSSSSNPDEWALAPAQGNAQFYRNEAESWDLRRHEAQQRFNEALLRQRDLEHGQRIHFVHQLYGPPPDLRQIHEHGRQQGMLDNNRIQEIRPRAFHDDSDDEIIGVVSGSDGDDHDPWDDHRHRRPLPIEHDHDRGRTIHELTGHKGRKKDKRSKSKKGKKDKKKKHGDSDSDSEDDNNKVFMQGVKAGIKVSRDRGSGPGGSDRGSPRNQRRRFLRDDDSDDSMNFRPRRSSRSRGRPLWGF